MITREWKTLVNPTTERPDQLKLSLPTTVSVNAAVRRQQMLYLTHVIRTELWNASTLDSSPLTTLRHARRKQPPSLRAPWILFRRHCKLTAIVAHL